MRLLGTLCATAVFLGSVTPAASSNLLGINFDGPVDSLASRSLADLAKTSRGSDGSVDSLGNPTSSSFNVILWGQTGDDRPDDQLHGTYGVSFTGRVTSITSWVNTGGFSIFPTGGSWSAAYNATTGQTTATMVITDPGNYNFGLTFTGAYRDAAATQPGITNLSIMRPAAPGSATPLAAGTVAYPPFLAQLGPFSVLRFMDFTATNGNIQVNWSDRTVPANFTYQNSAGANGYGWEGKGAPWEVVIQLANAANKDAWINIPTRAAFDYVYKVAQLFKCGSDGVSPWIQSDNVSCRSGTPAYAPLNSNLKLYVEYSNETWNDHLPQFALINTLWNAEPASSPIHYDDAINPPTATNDKGGTYAARFVAMRAAQISLIFRSVFGDAAMPYTGSARIRPLLESQSDNPFGPGGVGAELTFAESYMNNGDGNHVPGVNWTVPTSGTQVNPEPPAYYWYGGGGAAYYETADTSSPQSVISSGEFIPGNWVTGELEDLSYPLPFGLKRIAYEGGPNFGDGPNSGDSAVFIAARLLGRSSGTPDFTDVIESQHDFWTAYGGDLFSYFTLSNGYQYGLLTQNIYESATPALLALEELSSRTPAAVTVGQLIPGSVTGAAHIINQRGFGNDASGDELFDTADVLNRVVWAGYVFHSTAAANLNAALTFANAAGAVSVWVDGVQVAFNQTAVQGTMTFPAGTFGPGAHGVIVRANSGSFTLSSVALQSGSGVTPNPATRGQTITVTGTFTPNTSDTKAMVIFWIEDSTNKLWGRCGPNSTPITAGQPKTVSCTLAIPTTATTGAYHVSGTVYQSATNLAILQQLATFATFTVN